MTEHTNTPELRFPGFRDEWKATKLGSILEDTNIKENHDTPLYSLTVENGITEKTERYNREFLVKKNNNFKIVKPFNIVYNPMNITLGAIDLLSMDKEIKVSGYYNVLRIKNQTNPFFLINLLKTYKSILLFKKVATGSLREKQRVHFSEFKNLKKYLPSYIEQEKIGSFLSKLDRQIELEEKKLELLEQQKKGYMQNIFSRELSFKDENGKQYPEGNEYKLNEIGVFNSGIGFPESLQGGIEGIPFFKVSDMNTKGNEIVMKKSNNYVSKEIIDSKKWKVITNGPSMIFAKVGAAIMLNRKRLVLEPFLIDNNTMSYSFSNDWDINFGRILFQTIYLPKYAQVGALPSYNAKDIGTIKVKLPIKQEQEKIGSFFNKIDNLIELQTSKIELLKQRKQGLLQKMFV